MLLDTELKSAIIEKVFHELMNREDSDEFEKRHVEKWANQWVDNNAPSSIQPDAVDAADFFEWFDN